MKKLLLSLSFLGLILSSNAQTDLIISEYVEGWSNNKALEIFNPTNAAIDLSGYRITRYSNGNDVPPADNQWKIDLPAFTLEPYKAFVAVLDKRDPNGEGQEAPVWGQLQDRADAFLCPVYNTSKAMYFNGDDGVALEKTDGTLVDLFARWGAPRPAEALVGGSTSTLRCWTDVAPHFSGEGVGITADHTMVKKASVKDGVVTNPSIWNPLADWDTLPANTFSNLGWHNFDGAPANATPTFTANEFKFDVASTADNGFVLGTVTTNDSEDDAVKYFINYGNFIYIGEGDAAIRIEPFKLDKTTGELSLVDKSGLDKEVKDTFYIKVVATDGYSQTEEVTVNVYVDRDVNIKQNQVEAQISVWPNPSFDKSFNISSNKRIENISISNLIGQEIYTESGINAKARKLELTNIPNGVYLIKSTMEDNSIATQKVILK